MEELEREMEDPGFWDNPDAANAKMRELKSLKDVAETYETLATKYDDIETLIEMGYEEEDPELIPEIRTDNCNVFFTQHFLLFLFVFGQSFRLRFVIQFINSVNSGFFHFFLLLFVHIFHISNQIKIFIFMCFKQCSVLTSVHDTVQDTDVRCVCNNHICSGAGCNLRCG